MGRVRAAILYCDVGSIPCIKGRIIEVRIACTLTEADKTREFKFFLLDRGEKDLFFYTYGNESVESLANLAVNLCPELGGKGTFKRHAIKIAPFLKLLIWIGIKKEGEKSLVQEEEEEERSLVVGAYTYLPYSSLTFTDVFFCVISLQVPSYISRSVAGSYDNEAVAIFALIFTFYLYIKVVLGTLLAALVPVVGFNAVMTSEHFGSFWGCVSSTRSIGCI
ncbi:uncharacterized protein LOC124911613 [Impatiens glandulifera]|uniref:uncharacterized protein LOC124911613 n=1 Tax=Impatiens glandulifera TaxID=253017 RepID=UPI001FB0ED83|nr:uncharacterized protein LOC124911613 [Impatiens glandulifera]